ncbi:MAG: histone deacetylase [Chitinispirillaceae bacterium]|nr:histone deacetylase [Chitinispirillaceae bacterium]
MSSTTGYFFKESFLLHNLKEGHPEARERVIAINETIKSSSFIDKINIIEPSSYDNSLHRKWIAEVHSEDHIEQVISIPHTGISACDAVACVISAVDAIYRGEIRNCFCNVRPPGHHAHNEAHRDGLNQGEGFCFFNNVAVGVRYAQKRYGATKVLIVDWDYHHGNGTEWTFYDDPSVFYFSTHRLMAYPGSGSATRTGMGKGMGYNFNYPLPDPKHPFGHVFDEDLLRALNILIDKINSISFTPDIIFISAGFDGLKSDPLGDFNFSEEVFYDATLLLKEFAEKKCDGKIVSVLEGGYNPVAVAEAVEWHIKALVGLPK